MKKILAAVLLVACGLVNAQVVEPCTPRTVLSPNGSGTTPIIGTTERGGYIGWWCPNTDGTYRSYVLVGLNQYITFQSDLMAIARGVLLAADTTEAIRSVVAVQTTGFTETDLPDARALLVAGTLALEATKPFTPITPTRRWVTAGSGAVYESAPGKLVRVLVGRRAPLNVVVPCTVRIASGTSSYCTFPGALRPSEVTFVKEMTQ